MATGKPSLSLVVKFANFLQSSYLCLGAPSVEAYRFERMCSSLKRTATRISKLEAAISIQSASEDTTKHHRVVAALNVS